MERGLTGRSALWSVMNEHVRTGEPYDGLALQAHPVIMWPYGLRMTTVKVTVTLERQQAQGRPAPGSEATADLWDGHGQCGPT